MTTGLELYEALKEHVGEEAARMMAEAFPLTDEVATKTDLGRFEDRMDARLSKMEARLFRWMLGFFATLWMSNVGIIVTLILKS
jgi:hypothetical protein